MRLHAGSESSQIFSSSITQNNRTKKVGKKCILFKTTYFYVGSSKKSTLNKDKYYDEIYSLVNSFYPLLAFSTSSFSYISNSLGIAFTLPVSRYCR
jgi:hypothetical protein